ncbi:hypothetical protein KI387_035373 [Taxus chinensis]|uniref:Pentatricopeptide repeat-containing protein n=1 Tax=Taxus chinensis TaxID=29808 RepID=A0AA38L085_TAXCH|nr:hypothetical protein KI387_035373 [Taxus chinensis]
MDLSYLDGLGHLERDLGICGHFGLHHGFPGLCKRINLKRVVRLRAQLNDVSNEPLNPFAHVSETLCNATNAQTSETHDTEINTHDSETHLTETNSHVSETHYTETHSHVSETHYTETNPHVAISQYNQTNAHLADTHDRGVGDADMDSNASPHEQELLRSIINTAKSLPVDTMSTNFFNPYRKGISNTDCDLLLQLFGDEGLISQALHLLDWMGLQDPSMVSPKSYSIVFLLLGKAGLPENLWVLFEDMPDGKEFHCVNVYNALISGFSSCSRYDDAWKVFEEMEMRNIGPDSVTCTSLITIMTKSGEKAKDTWQFFERMSKNGVEWSSEIFGSLIKSFCNKGLMKESLIVLSEMERHSFEPNVDIFNTLIDAFGKANQLEEAEWLFLEMKDKHLQLTVSTYNSLIDAYSKKGRHGVVEELIQEMEQLGLNPDVWTFTYLISAYAMQKKMSDKAANAFLRMRKRDIFPSSHSYTALIHAYSIDDWHEKAYITFEEMIREGLKPSIETYTILLDGYRRVGDTQKLMEIWKMMMEDGIEGTRVIFNILVDGFAKLGHCLEARKVICEFGKKGLKPNVMTYNMLINAYARAGWHTKCPQVLKEMVAAGLKPDAYTYSTLIYAYFRVRDFRKASYYHKEMIKNKQTSNSVSYKKMKALLDAHRTIKSKRDKKAALTQIRKQIGLPSRNKQPQEFWKNKKKSTNRVSD